MLSPDQVRQELDELELAMDEEELSEWFAGEEFVYLSDGSLVRRGDEPGTLVVNGRRCYSAAWL